MFSYENLIEQFFYSEAPVVGYHNKNVRFEAIAAEVIGTKQRRFGPMPPPEAQVAVRDVLRESENTVCFLVPWGSRKQDDNAPLDILEFCAIKQLACLAGELQRFGVNCRFNFRIEDLTDRFLFGEGSIDQSTVYSENLANLAVGLLRDVATVEPYRESQVTQWLEFKAMAEDFAPIFRNYLTGKARVETLKTIGWVGDISIDQRSHYLALYATLYPGRDHIWELSKYFAATLARVKLKATCDPAWSLGLVGHPYITVSFTHPVPGNPVDRPRVYYRTIPGKFTHQHKAPWLARGYMGIKDSNACGPRFIDRDSPPITSYTFTTRWRHTESAVIYAPYAVLG